MKTSRLALAVALAAGLASTHAQTITDGNASFNLVGPIVFSTNNGDCTFLTDTAAVDQGFKYTWYYRQPNNNQNHFMSFIDTPAIAFAGNSVTYTYTNAGTGPGGVERFDASIKLTITDKPAPNTARVNSEVRFKNINPVAVTFQLFNLVDIDLSGTATNDVTQVTSISNGIARVTESSSANFAEIQGEGATRYEANSGTTLRSHLSGGSFNMANLAGPFTGDGAVGFQWTLTLAPGQEVVIKGGFALNTTVKACPPDFDGDGFLTGDDFDAYVAAFEAGLLSSDYDGDGFVTGDDFDLYVAAFEAGC